MFALFYSLWSNPNMKIYNIVKYLLQNNSDNSRTWSQRIKQLSQQYGLDDPSTCLLNEPPPKSRFEEEIINKITAYYEQLLRDQAVTNR